MNAFHLPEETHVSHVHLRTGNLSRVLDFYQRVIGLQVIDRNPVTVTLSATGGAPAIASAGDRNKAPRRCHPGRQGKWSGRTDGRTHRRLGGSLEPSERAHEPNRPGSGNESLND